MILLLLNICFIISVSGHFSEAPANVSAKLGASIVFRCSAESSVEPIIYSQWKSNTGSLLGYHQGGVLPGHQGRYSYVKQNSEQLNLKIENVGLDDDGEYECQMLHPGRGPIRAKSFLKIIVPPQNIHFASYQPNAVIPAIENTQLNITCVVPNVKPEPLVLWYIDGKKIDETSQQSILNLNKTFNILKTLLIRPNRKDHGKSLTCEVIHEESALKMVANATLSVLFPPSDPTVRILNQPNILRSGDNVTISCVVIPGNPVPDLFWYYNTRKLPSSSTLITETEELKNDYTFTVTAKDHMKEYECRVNNSHSIQKKKSLRLEVEFPPADVELFGETTIRFGSSANFQCNSLPSNPASQHIWKINDHEVTPTTQKERTTTDGIITSSNVTIHSNEVSYGLSQITVECLAVNSRGTTLRQHVVKILSPPKHLQIYGLEKKHFNEGDVLNVTCESQGGNPLAELVWYHGNEKMNEAQSKVAGTSSVSSLSIRLDRTKNGQKLKCEASNAALDEPLIESKNITVYYPPRRVFVKAANDENAVLRGETVRLVCRALSSNPPAEITWSFPGKKYADIQRGDMSLNETTKEHDFNVENVISFDVSEEDDGSVIYCIASSPHWKQVVNTTYTLNVLHPPILLVNGTVNVILPEGESFKENLTIKSNPAVSSWQWRKNGILFDHTIGRLFARGSVLTGKQLLSTDTGVYVLTATNSVGSTNITINLVVKYSARITSLSTPVIAAVGDTVILVCEADAEPEKSEMIKWFKNGILIPSSYSGNRKAIIRLNVTQQDSGEFLCQADNGVGNPAEQKTFILVNTAPKILRIPKDAKAAAIIGGTANLRCKVSAVPNVDFVWEKNGQIIKANNSKYSLTSAQLDFSTFESILTIKHIVPEDYAKDLKCIARNTFGSDKLSIPIVYPTNPEQPSNVSLTNSTLNSVSITWLPGFDGGADQTFELKYRKKNNDYLNFVNTTHSHLRVAGLAAAQFYDFQIRSINMRGFSSAWTNPVTFSTLDTNGTEIAVITTSGWLWIPYLLIVVIVFMLVNIIVCCFICNRSKKRKLREKTELVRTAVKGDVRQVQMYGTMANNTDLCFTEINEGHEISEDEHSVRTMIEVAPNGYMQPLEPGLYDEHGVIDYAFQRTDRNYPTLPYSPNKLTYANMPYPEPPQLLYLTNCTAVHPTNNNASSSHQLSTFIKPAIGVRTGPISYNQLDGDLV